MDEVEGVNRAAVESCNKLLNLLAQPQASQDQLQFRNLSMEIGEAVGKFRKVASLLSRTLGHARARISNNLPFSRNQNQAGIVKQEWRPSVNRSNVCSENPSLSLEIGLNYCNKSAVIGNPQPVISEQNRFHQFQNQRMQQHELTKYRFQQQQQQQQQQQGEMMLSKSNSWNSLNFESSSCTPTMSSNRSFISSLSIDGSLANVNGGAFQYLGTGRPLQRKKCSGRGDDGSLKCGSNRCHCSKKKKNRVKRSIKVPAISYKLADIPSDEYSWRKYGQKPIKGAPHPRGYYKCSSVRGCPARKHVERSLEEPAMLIVTYEGEHKHHMMLTHSANT